MISRIPLRVIPDETDGNHLTFTAYINGNAVNMLIDTGASKTVFDKSTVTALLKSRSRKTKDNRLNAIGIGSGTLKSQFITLPELKLGDHLLADYQALLLDLSQINAAYSMMGREPVAGILGGDLMLKMKAVIDYRNKRLSLNWPKKRVSGR